MHAQWVPLQRFLQRQLPHLISIQSHASGHHLHPLYPRCLPKVQIFRELPRYCGSIELFLRVDYELLIMAGPFVVCQGDQVLGIPLSNNIH